VTETRSFWDAVKWAFVLAFGRRAFGTIFTFVLAALLGPHDFGLMAMALIYITLLQLLLEQGFMTAIVQRKDLEPAHLDSAFWLNVGWCIALAGVGVASSGLWARINGEPELQTVVQVLSVLVVIEGLALVQQAVLQRELKFKRLALRSNVAGVVGGLTGVALALNGAGVWALVAQLATIEATALVLIWAMSEWRPRLRFSRRHARELLPFSFGVFLSNVGGFVGRSSDALLLGIFFGPVAVGLYRLADRFVEVVLEATTSSIGAVSLPMLSRVQADPEALRRRLEACLRAVLLVTVPGMLVLAACSEELLGVLGQEWALAAGTMKLLAFAGVAKGIAHFTGPVLFAVARAHLRAVIQWAVAACSATVVVIAGLLLVDSSLRTQILGMASAKVLLLVLLVAPVNLLVVSRITGYRLRGLLPALPPPLLAGVAAIAGVALLRWLGLFEELPSGIALAASVTVAVAIAGGVLVSLEPQARSLARLLLRRRGDRVPQDPLPAVASAAE
jgi:O-antigen/teichoic acid export membrane protein